MDIFKYPIFPSEVIFEEASFLIYANVYIYGASGNHLILYILVFGGPIAQKSFSFSTVQFLLESPVKPNNDAI